MYMVQQFEITCYFVLHFTNNMWIKTVIQAKTKFLSATHEMLGNYINNKPVTSDVNGEASLLVKSSTRDWKEETGM
jgi:hypothetical protein